MEEIPPVEESRNYIEKEHYKYTTEWWKKQCDELQSQIDKLKKNNAGLGKKIHKLRTVIKDKDFEFIKWESKWKNSIFYKGFKRFHRQ